MRTAIVLGLVLVSLAACQRPEPAAPGASPDPAKPVTVSVVATTDLHGSLEALPILGGYIANLRRQRDGDGGGVVLVDSGDIFQGTLDSNLNEGAAAIEAYNALGYDAAAIGNHEFDFGPAGPDATPRGPDDDPRGALKARAAEAEFPLLAANLAEEDGGRVDWDNAPASSVVEVAGVRVGIIGVTTVSTPGTTIATNFEGLEVWPLLTTVRHQARRLRSRGASVVVVAAHAGSRCSSFEDPDDLSSCDTEHELFELAEALPEGLVDVVAGGHTHAAVAHRVGGTPVVQAYANGAAFARVDLEVRPDTGDVVGAAIHPPVVLCEGEDGGPRPPAECDEHRYAGAPVAANEEVAAIVGEARAVAGELRRQSLEVELAAPIERAYKTESALGNLFADLMRDAVPDADLAITNAGGVRAELPAGELTYGELHRAMPFDNRFALVALRGEDLAELLADSLGGDSGILLVSGVRARARCEGGELAVELRRGGGAPIADDDELLVATSDYLAPGGGDGLFGELGLRPGAVRSGDGRTIRDAMAEVLRARGGSLSPADHYDPERPRLAYPGDRPVRCGDS